MPNSQELHIEKVSKPVFESSVTNDITYSEDLIPNTYRIPKPWTNGEIGSPMSFTFTDAEPYFMGFVLALGSTPAMAGDSIYYEGTDYEIAGDALGWVVIVADYNDPRSTWTIRAVAGPDIITMPYGLLPNQYTATYYELKTISILQMTVNSVSTLIYKNVGDIAIKGTATLGLFNHNKAPIYYEVVLKEKFDPYETITVSGSSTNYSVNQPIGGAAVVFYTEWTAPYKAYHAPAPIGDTHYPITMTETPQT